MEIYRTEQYDKWFRKLKDTVAKARIMTALRRIQTLGEIVGDIKPVGDGVYEMRFHIGPGYRIYYLIHGDHIMLLLLAGDKTSQVRDIAGAKQLAAEIRKDQSWQ